MTRPPKEPGTKSRKLTVQGWQNLVLSAMGVVVLAGESPAACSSTAPTTCPAT